MREDLTLEDIDMRRAARIPTPVLSRKADFSLPSGLDKGCTLRAFLAQERRLWEWNGRSWRKRTWV